MPSLRTLAVAALLAAGLLALDLTVSVYYTQAVCGPAHPSTMMPCGIALTR